MTLRCDVTRHAIDVSARREVILSAGAIDGPKLLMLSGLGPAEHLAAHDIPVVQDLSGVGGNLHDHLLLGIGFERHPAGPPDLAVAEGLGRLDRGRRAADQVGVERGLCGVGPGVTTVDATGHPEHVDGRQHQHRDRRHPPPHAGSVRATQPAPWCTSIAVA